MRFARRRRIGRSFLASTTRFTSGARRRSRARPMFVESMWRSFWRLLPRTRPSVPS
jgi:hypothetical protein